MSRNSKLPDIEKESTTRLRLWLRMLKVSRAVEAELRENLRTRFSSTLPRFDVMAALSRYPGGLKMSELSGLLMVSNGNVTGIVDRLVSDELISRNPVPGDRRALRVALTRKGKAEFKKQAAEHEKWINDLLGEVKMEDATDMMQSLERVTNTLKAKDD